MIWWTYALTLMQSVCSPFFVFFHRLHHSKPGAGGRPSPLTCSQSCAQAKCLRHPKRVRCNASTCQQACHNRKGPLPRWAPARSTHQRHVPFARDYSSQQRTAALRVTISQGTTTGNHYLPDVPHTIYGLSAMHNNAPWRVPLLQQQPSQRFQTAPSAASETPHGRDWWPWQKPFCLGGIGGWGVCVCAERACRNRVCRSVERVPLLSTRSAPRGHANR